MNPAQILKMKEWKQRKTLDGLFYYLPEALTFKCLNILNKLV